MLRRYLTFSMFASGLIAAVPAQVAAQYTFTAFDVPGSIETRAMNINSNGDIVGGSVDVNGVNHGFLLTGGAYTQIDVPGAILTGAWAVNDHQDVVGRCDDPACDVDRAECRSQRR